MSELTSFLENLTRFGLEHFRRYYGQYRGNVARNDDPEERGRIQAYVPAVGHKKTAYPDIWIEPAMQGSGSDRGMFFPPEIGDSVWVTFSNGDARFPNLYFGGWYGFPDNSTEVPKELGYKNKYPQRRGIVTRAGHVIQFDDESGKEALRIVWHKPDSGDKSLTDRSVSADRTLGKWGQLSFEPNGDVLLANQEGSLVYLDAGNKELKIIDQNGNSITMGSSGVRVIDKSGNFVTLVDNRLTISCAKDVLVTSSSIGVQTGGVDIKAMKLDLACPMVTLGSPAAMPLIRHTPWAATWATLSGVAEGMAQAFMVPPGSAMPVVGSMLAPFFRIFSILAQMYPALMTANVKAS